MKPKFPNHTEHLSRRKRRIYIRLSLFFIFLGTVLYALSTQFGRAAQFPRDIILGTKPESSKVRQRYVLFTSPVDDGDWPSLFSTKGKLLSSNNETDPSFEVYSGIPRNVGKAPRIKHSDIAFAMAADSTHIMSDDFLPKKYLAGTGSMLIVMLSPDDRRETRTIQDNLEAAGLKAFVMRIGSRDQETRKLEMLAILKEYHAAALGSSKYYAIIEQDTLLPSLRSFLRVLSRYNPIESHLIADHDFTTNEKSYTPVVLTASMVDRIFEDDRVWERCISITTGSSNSRISKCVAMAQGNFRASDDGPPTRLAKYDAEDFVMRQVDGLATGVLENGRQPLCMRIDTIAMQYPDGLNVDLFKRLLLRRQSTSSAPVPAVHKGSDVGALSGPVDVSINASEILSRMAFYRHDRIVSTYSHGFSFTEYPLQLKSSSSSSPSSSSSLEDELTEKVLERTEVTWNTDPAASLAALDKTRPELSEGTEKVSYYLHAIKEYSAPLAIDKSLKTVVGASKLDGGKVQESREVRWVAMRYRNPTTASEVQVDWVVSS